MCGARNLRAYWMRPVLWRVAEDEKIERHGVIRSHFQAFTERIITIGPTDSVSGGKFDVVVRFYLHLIQAKWKILPISLCVLEILE